MNEEIEDVERRLEKLNPLEHKALAAKILESWQTVKRQPSTAALPGVPPLFDDTVSASPRMVSVASPSLGPAFIGAIVGAAATFLGMTFFLPPKVEIREVVRDVRVTPAPATDGKKRTEPIPSAERQSPRMESPAEDQSIAQAKVNDNLDDWLAQSGISARDLDILVAQREAIARQMGRHNSNSGAASGEFVPPRISPQEYRELFRELRL